MNGVTIGIDKLEVLREVNKLTAFTARQIEGGFDRIAATTDEEKIVLSFYEQAIIELVSKLSNYSPIMSYNGIDFVLPVTFDRSIERALSKAIFNYVINEICARWFYVTKPDEQKYSAASTTLYGDILNLLCKRNKPSIR